MKKISETVVILRCPAVLADSVRDLAAALGRPAAFVWRQAAAEYLRAHGVEVTK